MSIGQILKEASVGTASAGVSGGWRVWGADRQLGRTGVTGHSGSMQGEKFSMQEYGKKKDTGW